MPEGDHYLPIPSTDFNPVSISDGAIRRGHTRIQVMGLEDVFSDLFDLADRTSSFSEIGRKFGAPTIPTHAEEMSIAELTLGGRQFQVKVTLEPTCQPHVIWVRMRAEEPGQATVVWQIRQQDEP